jgi:hypothetical protein
MRASVCSTCVCVALFVTAAAQQPPSIDSLVDALRPALPYPAAAPDGEMPADGGSQFRWFVVWPSTSDSSRITVKANPLHPDTQAASAAAMERIQEAVVAAERKAQAAYDRALDELKRTGKGTDLDGITLDDEGAAGQMIDAELELTIDLQSDPQTFTLTSSKAPVATQGSRGVSWIVDVPANTYREKKATHSLERFRAAESRLYFGPIARPTISQRGDEPHFTVTLVPNPGSFAVILRGNEDLQKRVVSTVDWNRLGTR